MINPEKVLAIVNEKKTSVTDLNLNQIVPNNIDNVILTISNNKCEMILPKSMSGNDFKRWKNNRGGIFSRDLINFTLNKPYGKYLLIEGNKEKAIIRLIEDDELDRFETLKLVDGVIKDKSYMILRHMNNQDSLIKTDIYIEQGIEEAEVPKIIIPDITSIPEDSDNHIPSESISLFD